MTDDDEKELPRAIKGNPAGVKGPFKPAPAATPVRAQLELPPGIPVAVMRFLKGTQVPGVATTTELKSHTASNRRKWDIEFIPQVRHFKITYTPPDVGEPKVMMVHETRVETWDPAL